MGTGYTRNDTVNNIADGNIINASDLDGEFDAVQAAFDAATGHTHDGTTGEGAPIEVTGPAQEYVSTNTEFRPKANNTYDLGSAANQWKDLYVDGTANLDAVDIDGGNIDGTTIGASTAAAGTFTTATATTGNITTVNATTVDTTNIEVTNIKAKDGTAAGSIADATGVVTLASSVLTTTDINGGTIDGATIGGASAAAGTFTNLTASGTVNLSGATVSNGGTVTTVDINGGTIDGTVIGGSTPAAISGTTGTFSGTVTADGLTVDGGGSNVTVSFTPSSTFSTTVDFTNASSEFQIVSFGSGSVSADNFRIRDAGASRLNIAGNGDISFYEDTGTTPKFFWDASAESLGIGTSSPTATLDVAGAAATTGLKLRGGGNSGVNILDIADAGGAGQVVVNASGNVGIGNTVPDGNLTVGNTSTSGDVSIRIKGDATSRGFLMFGDAGGAQLGDIMYDHSDNHMRFRVNNSERMRITSSGNVGIGTSSPAERLAVFSGTNNSTVARFTGAQAARGLVISTFNSGGASFNDGGVNLQATEVFSVTTGATERMRIDSSGNVGIGTSSPAYKLDVQTASGENYIRVSSATNQDGGFRIAEGTTNKWLLYNVSASDAFAIYDNTAIAERLRIDSSGRVGIGTSSPAERLDVVGNINFAGRVRPASSSFNGSAASPTLCPGFDNDTGFFLPASNTIGFSTVGTERMRIDSSGNVGIGTSSPDVGMHLRVFGNAFYTAQYGTGNKGLFGADATGAVVAASGAIPITFYTNNNERARFTDSGYFFFNNTSAFYPGVGNTSTGISFEPTGNGPSVFISRSDNNPFNLNRNTDGAIAAFRRSGVEVGTITVTSSATSYNTSSDYRLKENVTSLTGAADRLAQIPVHRFNFIADPDRTVDGFLAHEVQEFVPEAITGEKDGEEMQAIDHSKLVPLLTAALQEALERIAVLEEKCKA